MSAQPINPDLPPDHVTVEIDGVQMAAPKGSMIIHAADKAGIPIPRFCYHDKLSIAANCRMCLVEVEKMPKPAPACATPVMDGMKVRTRSEKALKYQRSVMEFLLINHPLDCPVCDQGGECELQDLSIGYGRSISRFSERKRTVPDENIGPLVATEMTRCIQCTRCVRFTAEVAGTYELGSMYRGENLQIGTYDGKPLTTELSGNVIDVCPVGALTNKVFQFKARPWELIARESVGYHDALGSNLFLHVRRGEVLRTVPRENEAVNECWLSDRDRYSHEGLYATDRASVPMIKNDGEWREVSWEVALERAAAILRENGADDLGMLVHPATSNEEGALLARLAETLGTGNIDHRIAQIDLSDNPVASVFGMPVVEIDNASTIIIVGSNIRHELPLVHARIRKAWLSGAKVHVVNPVDFDFAFELVSRTIVAPSSIASAVSDAKLRDAIGSDAGSVIIVGQLAGRSAHASAIRSAIAALATATGAHVCHVPEGANAIGLSEHGVLPASRDANAMLEEPRSAYVIYGIEPGLDFASIPRALSALDSARVVAFSTFGCESTRAIADVILPIGLLPEIDATLTNVDGLQQRAVAGGSLPGQARPGWRVIRALATTLGAPGFEFTDLAGARASISRSAPTVVAPNVHVDAMQPQAGTTNGMELATGTAIYRCDAVTRRAPSLQAHPLSHPPRALMNPVDATSLGLIAGSIARFGVSAGSAMLPVEISEKVAAGTVYIESGHGATAPLGAGRVDVARA